MKKITLHILRGIGLGCVFFTFTGIIFDIIFKGSFLLDHWYYTKMAIGSMITGIAFYVPSLVYQNEKLSKGLQVFIHMGIGLLTYISVGLYVGWIPLQAGGWVVAVAIVSAVVISFLIWFGFYLYYRLEAKRINEKLKEKQGI
ncbi:MAG: DUF3021 domain-containing protein [Acutalibacteraceae bacterium]|nr:DUF3021 domain-containing protein [Acutalibacteraceae bacterium]